MPYTVGVTVCTGTGVGTGVGTGIMTGVGTVGFGGIGTIGGYLMLPNPWKPYPPLLS